MLVGTVVGARPQFIKAAVVSHAFKEAGVSEQLVHTGQHYDADMSEVFFGELGIPSPHVNLEVGSGSHAVQTAAMMTGLETVWMRDRPDCVLVYGDTNSTVAAAMVASKLGIPLAHVEAGLRSFNRRMPEEINRIVTDRLSDWLFCPTQTAVDHLASEGMTHGVVLSGDVMLDATRFFAGRAAGHRPLDEVLESIQAADQTLRLPSSQLASGSYYLATVHRAENTDDPDRLRGIFDALGSLGASVLLPLHPRTLGRIQDLDLSGYIHVLPPVSYLAMLTLISESKGVLTDSGGLQKETVWLGKPCITLRDETEWTETLERGWNRLVGASPKAILAAAAEKPAGRPPAFGEAPEGTASACIVRSLLA
ncbi:MAG: UDP-N-acetylglucosamine 2-epimerase (non-hydrolyzing) [Bacteroidota bacterium]|nr:UDP-N-acetylglucosamine 2-epimerase (non-hydrolyzing) [Bacteroidota bacterium]